MSGNDLKAWSIASAVPSPSIQSYEAASVAGRFMVSLIDCNDDVWVMTLGADAVAQLGQDLLKAIGR